MYSLIVIIGVSSARSSGPPNLPLMAAALGSYQNVLRTLNPQLSFDLPTMIAAQIHSEKNFWKLVHVVDSKLRGLKHQRWKNQPIV